MTGATTGTSAATGINNLGTQTFSLGVTTVTYTVTDGSGNTATCSYTVTITDNIAPAITCPAAQTIVLNGSCAGVLGNYTSLATVSDNCTAAGSIVVTQSPAIGSAVSGVGTTVVTLTATDASGNFTTCTFNVNRVDNTAPVVTCPGNQTVPSTGTCAGIIGNYIASTSATDNCTAAAAIVITQSPVAGTNIVAATPVTMTATDANGNSSTCTFLVTPVDTTPPVIVCSHSILTCDEIVNYTLQFSDNCAFDGYVIIPAQYTSGSQFPIGTTTITVHAWDVDGNVSSCSFDVTVDPTDCCTEENLSLIDIENPYPCYGEQVDISLTQYFDWIEWYVSIDGGDNFELYPSTEILFTISATSDWVIKAMVSVNGCAPVWTAPVVLNVVELPIISGDINLVLINCQAIMPDMVSSLNLDPCWNFVQSIPPGTTLSAGTYIYSIEELNSGASFIATVYIPDNEAPVIQGTNQLNLIANDNCGYNLSFDEIGIIVTDCLLADTLVYVNGIGWDIQSPMVVFQDDVVLIEAIDLMGNISSHTVYVMMSDLSCPVFQGEQVEYIDVEFDGNCGYVVSDFSLLYPANDNCDGIISPLQTPLPGTIVYSDITVSLMATDLSGNSCNKYIQVVFVDTAAPTISCPDTITAPINELCVGLLGDVIPLVSMDDCTSLSVFQYPEAGTVYSSFQPIEISILIEDEFGNISTCDVINTWDPIEPILVSWPLDQTIFLEDDCSAFAPDYSGIEVQNGCDYSIVQSPPGGSQLSNGSNEISLTLDQGTGDYLTYSFTIQVLDTMPPIVVCPSDVTVSAGEGLCGAIVNYTMEVADNCGIGEIELVTGFPSGSFFPLGVNPVTYDVYDISGNVNTCSFQVVVQDLNAPIVTTIDVTSCSEQVFYDMPIVSDECEYTLVPDIGNIESGSLFPLGSTILSYTATDSFGNSTSAAQTITVLENPQANWLPLPNVVCENDDVIDLSNLVESTWSYEFNQPFGVMNLFDPALVGPGIYSITLTTSNGPCFEDSTQFIEILAMPEVQATDYFEFCGLTGQISIESNASDVEWILPVDVVSQGSVFQESVDLVFPEYGDYELIALSSYDGMCPVSSEISVSLWAQPISVYAGEDQILYIIDYAILYGENVGVGNLQWSADNNNFEFTDPNNSVTEVNGLQSGLNTLFLTVTNGPCEAISDEVVIDVKGMIIPTMFSPNGDGANDSFEIRGLQYLPQMKLIIYDDWGIEIFSSDEYNNQWGGTMTNGSLCADGTYYYSIQIGKESLLGFIEIKR
jgi:gliding motility-associated-like protein